jgi:hypothetical protein
VKVLLEGKLTPDADEATVGAGVTMADTMPSKDIVAPKHARASRMMMWENILVISSLMFKLMLK